MNVICGNTTAISFINNMESINSETFKSIAYRILEFCTDKKFWISKADQTGSRNEKVDAQSRMLCNATKWQLKRNYFQTIFKYLENQILICFLLELLSN